MLKKNFSRISSIFSRILRIFLYNILIEQSILVVMIKIHRYGKLTGNLEKTGSEIGLTHTVSEIVEFSTA